MSFLRALPFTEYGFELHDEADVRQRLVSVGFVVEREFVHFEKGESNAGGEMEKKIHVIVCRK
ncbi:MAG: hypothetical protein AAF664_24865 [Planctomycetota bacterium]